MQPLIATASPPPVVVRLLFFAESRDIVGSSRLELQLSSADASTLALRSLLTDRFPALRAVLARSVFAVNQVSDRFIYFCPVEG